jgi:hypothetical protein
MKSGKFVHSLILYLCSFTNIKCTNLLKLLGMFIFKYMYLTRSRPLDTKQIHLSITQVVRRRLFVQGSQSLIHKIW